MFSPRLNRPFRNSRDSMLDLYKLDILKMFFYERMETSEKNLSKT